ncbi:MAG TPA: universal stress protein [Candidatus Acetothermia bacterium]|nr:universal stress protein [Candidatus Acetothermia bacterium]
MQAPFKKVLVPIDGSSYSIKAGEYGISLAKAYGAAVISLYVIDEAAVRSLERLSGQDAQTLRRKLHKEGEVCLHGLHQRAQEEGVDLTEIVKEGLPHRVIVELAQEEGVDLIVIGKVGQRGPRRILIGSVTERVLEAAKCPVLVVRPE